MMLAVEHLAHGLSVERQLLTMLAAGSIRGPGNGWDRFRTGWGMVAAPALQSPKGHLLELRHETSHYSHLL